MTNPQLQLPYAAAVEQATRQKVVETWLVLPVAGAALSIARD
jgi:hypothetical protein